MEEELWMIAAKQVLTQAKKPLHYTDIKRIILERGLINPGLKTTLEEALFKEIQRTGGRFRSILNQPGVFELVKTETKEEPGPFITTFSRPSPSILRRPIKVKMIGAQPRVKVNTPNTSALLQERYKNKYKKLKRQLKDIVFMNAAICDNVIKAEEKVQRAKDQRRYLLARLLQHQAQDDTLQDHNNGTPSAGPGKPATQSIAQILGEVEKRKKKTVPGMLQGGKKKTAKEILEDPPKPRPRKKGFSGRRIVHQIPLDNLGRPIFPIELGHLTIYCLGEIVNERSTFHSLENIFPAGFCSTRVYCGLRNPEEQCLYTCKILDNGPTPKFEISPDDAPECVFSGITANECHIKLLQAINTIRGFEIVPLIPRGAEFFGLSHPTVQNLLQSCPGAKKCNGYKWQRFEVSRMPASEAAPCDGDEPTINVDALFALPTFADIISTAQAESNLRNLLTNTTATS